MTVFSINFRNFRKFFTPFTNNRKNKKPLGLSLINESHHCENRMSITHAVESQCSNDGRHHQPSRNNLFYWMKVFPFVKIRGPRPLRNFFVKRGWNSTQLHRPQAEWPTFLLKVSELKSSQFKVLPEYLKGSPRVKRGYFGADERRF